MVSTTFQPPQWQTGEQAKVLALRQRLFASGYRPVAVYNFDAKVNGAGKRPFETEWQIRARRDPPEAVVVTPRLIALNTGILCDGQRAVDVDVDDPTLASTLEQLTLQTLGTAPVRWRADSPRCLLLYRAAEGTPRKLAISGPRGKIEVLGWGQQFVAYGRHSNGAVLQWRPDDPALYHCNALNVVTEVQIRVLIAAAAPLLGAATAVGQQSRANSDARQYCNPTPAVDANPAQIWNAASYALNALKSEADALSILQPGSGRNGALNKAAFAMGTLVGAGWIDRATVEAVLFDAARFNGYRDKRGDRAAWDTIQSGLAAGIRRPRRGLNMSSIPPVNFNFRWPRR
jgi:hypothetical protein